MNKTTKIVAVAAALALSGAAAVFAASNVAQTITMEVTAINEISVSGNPGAMTISTATAGAQPDAVTNALTTYSITTNGTGMKITGVLNSVMPTSVTLTVSLAAPTVGTSAGAVTLTAAAADLVTGITQVATPTRSITYNLSATVAAGIVASTTRTVTLTVTN
jgi:hypothetical protein